MKVRRHQLDLATKSVKFALKQISLNLSINWALDWENITELGHLKFVTGYVRKNEKKIAFFAVFEYQLRNFVCSGFRHIVGFWWFQRPSRRLQVLCAYSTLWDHFMNETSPQSMKVIRTTEVFPHLSPLNRRFSRISGSRFRSVDREWSEVAAGQNPTFKGGWSSREPVVQEG